MPRPKSRSPRCAQQRSRTEALVRSSELSLPARHRVREIIAVRAFTSAPLEVALNRLVLLLSLVVLTACGSSPKSQAPPPGEAPETVEPRPDDSWMEERVGVFVCDAFVALMAQCRAMVPVEDHGVFDDGMKRLLAGMRGMDAADLPYACDVAISAAKDELSGVCPGVWPDNA